MALNAAFASSPWNPGIGSQIPLELLGLATIFAPANVETGVEEARELQQLTGLPLAELVRFRPRRLLLHELLIRVTADYSVPDGSRIEDLGINFRGMTSRLLERLAPQMPQVDRVYDSTRAQLEKRVGAALAVIGACPNRSDTATQRAVPERKLHWPSFATGLLRRLGGGASTTTAHGLDGNGARGASQLTPSTWGPAQIETCEAMASATADTLEASCFRSLARVMTALFTTHGRAWGTPELIVSLATNIVCNAQASEAIGRFIDPHIAAAAVEAGYARLPSQMYPVVINTKGASASGKSSLRPLQKQLAGRIGVRWEDFALISPDIWRKQLLDYGALGDAYKYAGAFTSDELQIVDGKLDRYIAAEHARGNLAHLLIDRFRFDSFAPDSDEAGSNLLTRFGRSVYLFFMITAPELLVERAWSRGLAVGRYKAVDDTLAHCVEAYAGMPDVFFTWVRRSDKDIHFEFLDNSVPLGELPRTVAFGDNRVMNVLAMKGLLDIVRFARVDVNATAPEALYPDPKLCAPAHNLSVLTRCVEVFERVNLVERATGRLYLSLEKGRVTFVDRAALQRAIEDDDTFTAVRAVAAEALADGSEPAANEARMPRFIAEAEAVPATTLGQWGDYPRKSQCRST